MPTLPQLIEPALALGQERALAERPAGGDWTYTSSAQLRARVTALAYALRGAGAERGDRVAIVSNNCVDWIVADLAIVYAGCVSVPIFATAAADQLRFILEDCEAKLVFVQRQADLERVAAACPGQVPIVHFDGDAPGSLAAFERAGALAQAADPAAVEGWIAAVRPDDLAVLIYTSGTTGHPKGVMLSQNNIGSDSLTRAHLRVLDAAAGGPGPLRAAVRPHLRARDRRRVPRGGRVHPRHGPGAAARRYALRAADRGESRPADLRTGPGGARRKGARRRRVAREARPLGARSRPRVHGCRRWRKAPSLGQRLDTARAQARAREDQAGLGLDRLCCSRAGARRCTAISRSRSRRPISRSAKGTDSRRPRPSSRRTGSSITATARSAARSPGSRSASPPTARSRRAGRTSCKGTTAGRTSIRSIKKAGSPRATSAGSTPTATSTSRIARRS